MLELQKLVAGDSVDFVTTAAAYPASAGWVFKYRLTPRFTTPAQAPITLTGTTYEVEAYRFQETPANTATWAAGQYGWASWVERAGERITLEQGREITVAPDPATIAQGVDTRLDSEQHLAAVKAALTGKASAGVLAYTINGRQLQHYAIADLLLLEKRLEAQVAQDRKALGMPSSGGRRRILLRVAA